MAARREQPYIPLFVQDFMTDEKLIECSAESTGVYIRLMCVMHKSQRYGTCELKEKDKQSEDPVENFAIKLAKQMPYDTDTITRSLRELVDEGVLTLEGDVLFQKRMVRDADLSDKKSAAGKKGADRTNSQRRTPKNGQPDEPDGEEEETAGKVEKRGAFEKFWEAYPNKVGKQAALKAFEKARKTGVKLETLIEAVEKQKESKKWKKNNGEFIPNPATWLNQGRWDDELEREGDENDGRNTGGPATDWKNFKPSTGFRQG